MLHETYGMSCERNMAQAIELQEKDPSLNNMQAAIVAAGFEADDVTSEEIARVGATAKMLFIFVQQGKLDEAIGTLLYGSWLAGYQEGKADAELEANLKFS